MITQEQAQLFAQSWIDAWNAHDLDRVMDHYDEKVQYSSIFLRKLTEHASARIQGRENVTSYLAKGLAAYPDLRFQLLHLFIGIDSLVLQYQSVNQLIAAEVFTFNESGKIVQVQCHYDKV